MCFRLIDAKKSQHPVSLLCSVLGVSRAGYYAWKDRPVSARQRRDCELLEAVAAIHGESKATYGWPRVHAELRHRGVRVSRKRVARLMRQARLFGHGRAPQGPHDDRGAGHRHRPGSRAPRLRADGARPALGRRPDRDRDVGGQALPGRRGRLLLAPLRRLGDGRAHARRAGRRRARDGALAAAPTWDWSITATGAGSTCR